MEIDGMVDVTKLEGMGHICTGGGAHIENSPINLHIHIHTEEATVAQKIGRAIYGILGTKHRTIENTSSISESELSGLLHRELEIRRVE